MQLGKRGKLLPYDKSTEIGRERSNGNLGQEAQDVAGRGRASSSELSDERSSVLRSASDIRSGSSSNSRVSLSDSLKAKTADSLARPV